MRLIAIAAVSLVYASGLTGQTPGSRADVHPQPREAVAADTADLTRAYRLFSAGEALERSGRRREAAVSFQDAATAAAAAGETHLAISFAGRAAAASDRTFSRAVANQLEASPMFRPERGVLEEDLFVQRTRRTVFGLRLVTEHDVTGMITSAGEAHAVLEDLAGRGRNTAIRVLSSRPGMEVRVRRWVFKFDDGPWETVRADTTLAGRIRALYQFCYLDPSTRTAKLIDQPCTASDHCTIALPSAHASTVENCRSGS